MKQSERDKLRVLLDYWVKHNKEHGEEFRGWAEKAKAFGDNALSEELVAAARAMQKANASLARALLRLNADAGGEQGSHHRSGPHAPSVDKSAST